MAKYFYDAYDGNSIQIIIAEDGTYPDNDVEGSIWYIKKGLAETATVTAQNGGETVSNLHTITWVSSITGMTFDIDLSKDNGQTWKSIATNVSGQSYTYDFSLEIKSSLCLLRIRPKFNMDYGVYDISDSVFTISDNIPPTPPINLMPSSIAIDIARVQRFSWTHNDTNSQSGFFLQWSIDGTTWNTITQSTINQYVDISANVFPLGTIIWKVKTTDIGGLTSLYSQQRTFIASVPSNSAIITSSASISVSRPVFIWSQSEQIAYQMQILNSLNVIIWDSLEINSTNKAMTSAIDLVNTAIYTLKIKTKNKDGLWTDYAIQNLVVSYTPPAIPVISIQTDNNRGAIQLRITNPTPQGTQPNVSYMEVYRSIKGQENFIRIATNVIGNFTDYTPQSSIIYEYYIKAKAVNNTYIVSKIGEGSINIKNTNLSMLSDYLKYVNLGHNETRNLTLGRKGNLSEFAGREYPVMDFAEQKVHEISVSFLILDKETLDNLIYIIDCGQTLLFRDDRSKHIFCVPSKLSIKDEIKNMWSVNFTLTRVCYSEVI